MVEKVNIDTFDIVSNYVLIKPDPNYDFVKIKGPTGMIELKLAYEPQDATKHLSITGKVIKLPKSLYFFSDKESHEPWPESEFEANMRNTMPHVCSIDVEEGQEIYFNYIEQLDAEQEKRLVDTDEYGICMLIRYDRIYGKKVDNHLVPINGWVFFKRDQKDAQFESKSGLLVLQKTNPYQLFEGTVICADEPIEQYLDDHDDYNLQLESGDRILLDKRFGYRLATDIHAGELKGVELIRRKNIIATL